MDDDPTPKAVRAGDAHSDAAIDVEVAHELLEPLMGGASLGAPVSPVYEPSIGFGIDDDGDGE